MFDFLEIDRKRDAVRTAESREAWISAAEALIQVLSGADAELWRRAHEAFGPSGPGRNVTPLDPVWAEWRHQVALLRDLIDNGGLRHVWGPVYKAAWMSGGLYVEGIELARVGHLPGRPHFPSDPQVGDQWKGWTRVPYAWVHLEKGEYV